VSTFLSRTGEALAIFDNKDFSRFSVKVLFAVIEDNSVSLFVIPAKH
jgi:hypothetical protein